MESCSLAKDYVTFEAVCRHVASHHRNDDDVLHAWGSDVKQVLRPSLPITSSTWVAINEVVDLLYAKTGWYDTSIMMKYAHFQALQGDDPSPVLERILRNKPHISLKTIPDLLKTSAVQFIRRLVEEGGHFSWVLIKNLLEAKETDLQELVNTAYNSSRSEFRYFSQVVPFLVKSPEYREILERAFPRLEFKNQNLMDLYWRWNPVLVGKHLGKVVGSLMERNGSKCILLKDYRLMSFFCLTEDIKGIVLKEWAIGKTRVKKNCLNFLKCFFIGSQSLPSVGEIEALVDETEASVDKTEASVDKTEALDGDSDASVDERETSVDEGGISLQLLPLTLLEAIELFKEEKMDRKLLARKMTGFCTTSPMSQVLSACLLLVNKPEVEAQAISIISAASSFSEAADFCSAHSSTLTTPAGHLAILRFYWKYFLFAPNEKVWCLIREASTCCHIERVHRVLRVWKTPDDFVLRLVELMWGKFSEDEFLSWERKFILIKKFIETIPTGIIKLLTAEKRLQMVVDSFFEVLPFVYHAWLADVNDIEINKVIKDKFSWNRWFAESFVSLVITESVKAKSVEVLSKFLDSPLLDTIVLSLVYRLQLVHLQLSSPKDFPAGVVSFLGKLPDPDLQWPLVAEALIAVVEDCELSLLDFLFAMSRSCHSRADRVLCAYLLPQSVPLPGPYVRDPNVKTYEDLLQALRNEKDFAVEVYLYMHLNNRVSV